MRALRADVSDAESTSLYFCDRHFQIPQAADHLSGRDLIRKVVAVAGVGIHLGRLQQAHLVVVPQRLHTQMGHPGELTHRQACCHAPSLNPPPTGVSRAEIGA